jgi:hypothetical protein
MTITKPISLYTDDSIREINETSNIKNTDFNSVFFYPIQIILPLKPIAIKHENKSIKRKIYFTCMYQYYIYNIFLLIIL